MDTQHIPNEELLTEDEKGIIRQRIEEAQDRGIADLVWKVAQLAHPSGQGDGWNYRYRALSPSHTFFVCAYGGYRESSLALVELTDNTRVFSAEHANGWVIRGYIPGPWVKELERWYAELLVEEEKMQQEQVEHKRREQRAKLLVPWGLREQA